VQPNNFLPDIPVVYSHSIGPVNKDWNRNYLTLELPFFEDQLRFIKENFQAIFFKEYWDIRNHRQPNIKNPIVITLDDGFLDNWIWAYPLLKKYGLKATIFVSPEFIDLRDEIRPNLEDFWNKKSGYEELLQWGYLSWPEMKEMLRSGLIDIQSHTMSHTKYVISDKLIGFHHPGNDCLYPVGNIFPELKPYHIQDKSFEMRLPYGYPLFEEQSSVCARKVTINPTFISECQKKLETYDFNNYSFETAFIHVQNLYEQYKTNGQLITGIESEKDYMNRVNYEISGSKKILENNLKKPIEFLCWPHGDNSGLVHQVAMNAGYLATTTGSKIRIPDSADRIPDRIGMFHVRNNRFLSLLKFKYKLGSWLGRFPYHQINASYNLIKYGKRKI
jgi:peptidoglycan/xylan/chitin deacetylase (PgdA/CDA1 family)